MEGPSTPSSILNASCSDVGRSGQQNEDSIMCLSNGCESGRALIQSAIEAINYGAMEITKNQLQARDLSNLIYQRSNQTMSMYEEEIFHARTTANQMYTEARVEQLNSEVYQNALVMVGTKATEMIKERDIESFRLRQTCELMESQTKQVIESSSSIVSEARSRIHQDEMCMELSGRQLLTLKSELAATVEITKQQQESIQNLRWIEDRVPDAQRKFAEMERSLMNPTHIEIWYSPRSSWKGRRAKSRPSYGTQRMKLHHCTGSWMRQSRPPISTTVILSPRVTKWLNSGMLCPSGT